MLNYLSLMNLLYRADANNWPGRWGHLQKLLVRSGPLAHQDFEPGPQVHRMSVNSSQTMQWKYNV